MSVVLDASALIASLLGEPGADVVDGALDGAIMSTVNLAEVAGHFGRGGAAAQRVEELLSGLPIDYVAPDRDLALRAGAMRAQTDRLGLALGDRFCLALAKSLGFPAVSADRAWLDVAPSLGVEVRLIR
jgi:PIN domain nuclease of toxin-antitoxin system